MSDRRRPAPADLPAVDQCVLAVLALAAIWPERFGGGWVTPTDFTDCGHLLCSYRKPETLKGVLRRAIRDIAQLEPRVPIESRRIGASRDHARRIAGVPAPALRQWLLGSGLDLVRSAIRTEFLGTQYQPTSSFEDVTSVLEEAVARVFLSLGQHVRAIKVLQVALKRSATPRGTRPLQLALATAFIRRGTPDDWQAAGSILTELLHLEPPAVDHFDRVMSARARITQAYLLYLTELRGKRSPSTEAHRAIDTIERRLVEAQQAVTHLSANDRAQVMNTRGLVAKWQGQVAADAYDRRACFDQAEHLLGQALTIWRTVYDPFALGAAIYNMGELAYVRRGLDTGQASEEDIREALRWYAASARYTRQVGVLQEWVLDYIRVAECHALLVPHLLPVRRAAATKSLGIAQAHLALAKRQPMATKSLQQRAVARVVRIVTRMERLLCRGTGARPRRTQPDRAPRKKRPGPR